jgi:hypothetical protein
MDAEPKIPSAIEGLETFTLGSIEEEKEPETGDILDAESFFSMPADKAEDDDDK